MATPVGSEHRGEATQHYSAETGGSSNAVMNVRNGTPSQDTLGSDQVAQEASYRSAITQSFGNVYHTVVNALSWVASPFISAASACKNFIVSLFYTPTVGELKAKHFSYNLENASAYEQVKTLYELVTSNVPNSYWGRESRSRAEQAQNEASYEIFENLPQEINKELLEHIQNKRSETSSKNVSGDDFYDQLQNNMTDPVVKGAIQDLYQSYTTYDLGQLQAQIHPKASVQQTLETLLQMFQLYNKPSDDKKVDSRAENAFAEALKDGVKTLPEDIQHQVIVYLLNGTEEQNKLANWKEEGIPVLESWILSDETKDAIKGTLMQIPSHAFQVAEEKVFSEENEDAKMQALTFLQHLKVSEHDSMTDQQIDAKLLELFGKLSEERQNVISYAIWEQLSGGVGNQPIHQGSEEKNLQWGREQFEQDPRKAIHQQIIKQLVDNSTRR